MIKYLIYLFILCICLFMFYFNNREGFNLRKKRFNPFFEQNNIIHDKPNMTFTYKNKTVCYKNLNKTYINEKSIVKKIFVENGIPTSNYYMWKTEISDTDNLNNMIMLSRPLVIKPDIGECGIGVTTDVVHDKDIVKEVKKIIPTTKNILIEEQVQGCKEYRITVLNGEVIGASEKITATITGDGVHSISDQIEIYNSSKIVKEHKIHTVDYNYIKQQGYDKEDVLPSGKKLILTNVANMNNGSTIKYVDITTIDPMNMVLFTRINELLNYTISGIDYLGDLSVPYTILGSVIEVNPNPSISIHYDVAVDKDAFLKTIVDNLFRH